jgi:hypothetical protein
MRDCDEAVTRVGRATAPVGDGNSMAECPALNRVDEGPTPSHPTTPFSTEARGVGSTARLHPDAPERATGMRLVARP